MPKWFYCAALARAPDQGLAATPRTENRWLLWTWLSDHKTDAPQLIDHFPDQDALNAYCQTYDVAPAAADHPQILLQDWQQRCSQTSDSVGVPTSEAARTVTATPTDSPPQNMTLICAIRGAGIAALSPDRPLSQHASWLLTPDGSLALWPSWPNAIRDLQAQGHRPWLYTPQAVRQAALSPSATLPAAGTAPWFWAQWADDAWGLWQGPLHHPRFWCDEQQRPVLLHSLAAVDAVVQTQRPGLWTPPGLWLSYYQTQAQIQRLQSREPAASSVLRPSLNVRR